MQGDFQEFSGVLQLEAPSTLKDPLKTLKIGVLQYGRVRIQA